MPMRIHSNWNTLTLLVSMQSNKGTLEIDLAVSYKKYAHIV